MCKYICIYVHMHTYMNIYTHQRKLPSIFTKFFSLSTKRLTSFIGPRSILYSPQKREGKDKFPETVLYTNDRHRFLRDGFQPVNSFQYTTAAIHERDKYSWHKCIFMNKWLPLPLIVFAVQSVKNGPSFP